LFYISIGLSIVFAVKINEVIPVFFNSPRGLLKKIFII